MDGVGMGICEKLSHIYEGTNGVMKLGGVVGGENLFLMEGLRTLRIES